MDKTWIKIIDRTSQKYIDGIDTFLNWAYSQPSVKDLIRCPCKKCRFSKLKIRREIRGDLFIYGFLESYEKWVYHGEELMESPNASNDDNGDNMEDIDDDDDIFGMIRDACMHVINNETPIDDLPENKDSNIEEPALRDKLFYNLLNDAKMELYPNSTKMSKLSFIVKLFHLKSINHWSDTSIDRLLDFFKELLPKDALIPSSYYEARKFSRELGLDYIKIDACKNHCILFWKEYDAAEVCPICLASRWKSIQGKSKIPHKVLHYFPIKPRLRRFYMSSHIAENMRWHKAKRVDDGILRHPADSNAWKSFDELHEQFSADARNVRLGLASDEFIVFVKLCSHGLCKCNV